MTLLNLNPSQRKLRKGYEAYDFFHHSANNIYHREIQMLRTPKLNHAQSYISSLYF